MKKLHKLSILILCILFMSVGLYAQQHALHFNSGAPSDHVVIPNSSSLNLSTGRFTIEAMIKMPKAQLTWPTVIANRIDNGTSSPGFAMFIANGKLSFQIRGVNTISGGPDLLDDSCHHVAVVRDSTGKVTGYVDGVSIGSSSNSLNMTNTHAYWIGLDDAEFTSSQFLGTIDEIRIWNITRTVSQINANKNSEISNSSGLVAYYKFNQGNVGVANPTITTLTDATGNGHNGTLTGFALTGIVSNWVSTSCVNQNSCDYFKLEANDTNCCQAGIVRTMAGGPNVIKVKFVITGGVAQGYTSNCPGGSPISANVGGFASRTITFPACNMQFFTTSLQSTTASGNMVASYTVYFANGDSCTYKTDVKGCPRAPKRDCDRLTVAPYVYPGLDLSGRRFTVHNLKFPTSPICKILVSLSPVPSTGWQGGGLQARSWPSLIFPPAPGTYFAAPYQVIPSGSANPWPLFSPNSSTWVKFNLGVDFTINWTGDVILKVIHCDGDTCTLSYKNWQATQSNTQQQFTTALKMNDSLFAVSLSLGLPTIKNKTIKWLGVEVTKDNSEIFSITGGRYDTEKKNDTSRLPLSSSEQSSSFALFELDDNMKLDGSASQLPINMVFKGHRPSLHLTGYDENGNEVISDTFTVKKNVAGVYQMVKTIEDKIGLMAYPNPSASEVTLSYFIEDASEVEFTIFDITGTFINTYAQGKKASGNYEFKIDNSSLATGTYIVKMKTEKYTKSVIMQVGR